MKTHLWGEVDDSGEPSGFSHTAFGDDACEQCWRASREVSHEFHAACKSCQARALSRGPDFDRCLRAGKLDKDYRDLLRLADLTHEQVKEAAAADAMGRKA